MNAFKYEINGNLYEVVIEDFRGDQARVTVNGVTFDVEVKRERKVAKIERPKVVPGSGPQPERVRPQGGAGDVKSPLPAVVRAVAVKEGDEVRAGQPIIILEAMKMENEIAAPTAGKVVKIHVQPGQNVLEGDPLISIQS